MKFYKKLNDKQKENFQESLRNHLSGAGVQMTDIVLGRIDTFFNNNEEWDKPKQLSDSD